MSSTAGWNGWNDPLVPSQEFLDVKQSTSRVSNHSALRVYTPPYYRIDTLASSAIDPTGDWTKYPRKDTATSIGMMENHTAARMRKEQEEYDVSLTSKRYHDGLLKIRRPIWPLCRHGILLLARLGRSRATTIQHNRHKLIAGQEMAQPAIKTTRHVVNHSPLETAPHAIPSRHTNTIRLVRLQRLRNHIMVRMKSQNEAFIPASTQARQSCRHGSTDPSVHMQKVSKGV